ncbi:MAG: hypothetical protein A2848_01395 [Candidatus Magasanikbacteria bacterium RIFCSPHIGHO2_01_FULL_50_8]|uniref:Plasmid stabilization protein n=2 Tax=Candidatus Magasanikiibacteriota TaxID=1752731 RepID=A0A1F6LS53_9BACT|nr:MAG: hypothetical protein A2848_01395 [Candidatus Magasanikbacteria bacterium RIFCSPHIGHO2_01_FULL_50_8]OGH67838.1 MAG: hypothetical protein A3C15_02150 [Candidatus Magasanikbacteria bacterium RIFCSPHIGHO2_02_FULL_50_9b]
MHIFFHRVYLKRFHRLSPFIKRLTERTIQIFKENPFDPRLHNHVLHGSMNGRRAISVTHEVRIIFEEKDSHTIILFLDIGRHDQVY